MKKKLFYAVVAIGMLASCADNEYVGEVTPNPVADGTDAIVFNSGAKKLTRAGEIYGAAAAEKLKGNFVVEGIKNVSGKIEVFDNYNVNWGENTANKTASNTANWEYVAQAVLTGGKTKVSEQTIKYWDFAASQYDFWAYSLGGGEAEVISLDHDAALTTKAYTITGDKTNLSKVYISDLQTAYNPVNSVSGLGANVTPPVVMGDEVVLTFRSLVTKVRVGLYETVPGYSIRDVKFYPSEDGTAANAVVLYASGDNIPTFGSDDKATYEVKFPTIGGSNIGNSDYNRAHVALASGGTKTSKIGFGELKYGEHENNKHELTGYSKSGDNETWTEIWVQRSTSQPTWAKETSATAGDYSIVLPNENGEVLTLKVDYTLESTDGSGEPITVYGATALVPSQFTQWKPNFAYTYIFKISDNTNGLTNKTVTEKIGLYPITLNAVVIDSEDGTQETITTVATPSITTYSITSDVTTNNEYTTSDDIYVTATSNGTLTSMTGKAVLYDITKSSSSYGATEAEVLAALTTYSTLSGGKYTGRNSVVLDPVASGLDLSIESIPLVDGNSQTITAGQAALIAKSKLTAGHYYAFVFDTTSGTASTVNKYEAVTPAVGTDVTSYYVDTTSGTKATGTANGTDVYYDRYTTSTATYAIKVIKIKE